MPIFARRRLQAMLSETAGYLAGEKRHDLVQRLESKRPDQVLSAVGELTLLWAISQLGSIEHEPEWWGRRHPDMISSALFQRGEAAIEVKSISNGPVAGEAGMRRAVEKMSQYANQIKKGAGKHLHFRFAEESFYSTSGYIRRRKISSDFELDDHSRCLISRLVKSSENIQERLFSSNIDVVIGRSKNRILGQRYFCTMPPEFHSIEGNPVFDALEEAKSQLRNEHFHGQRIVVLFDAGCVLLRNLNDFDASNRRVSGQKVILHFLSRIHGTSDGGIEVAVLSASREALALSHRPVWKLTVFDEIGRIIDEGHPLHAAIKQLPPPRLEGYQARQRLEDGIFHDAKFRAFAASVVTSIHSSKEGSTKLKLSSRLLMEFLAGNISEADFRYGLGIKDGSPFATLLRKGLMPSNVTLEAGGHDKDDDYIVLEFDLDPSVSPLK